MGNPSRFSTELPALIVCPQCRQRLAAVPDKQTATSFRCVGCGNQYPVVDGIPVLLIERATKVQAID